MDLIKRLARSHMARAYGLLGLTTVLLLIGSVLHNYGITGAAAVVAFFAGAEFNGEVICPQCGTSLDSEELPDGTEPDSGEHGFRFPGRSAQQIADEAINRWYDEPNRSRLADDVRAESDRLRHGLYPEDRSER